MNKKLNIILIFFLAATVALSAFTLATRKHMAFFDYNEVYNNCELKLKLENDLQRIASGRKSELDSLQLELSFMSQKIKANQASAEEMNTFEEMKKRFLTFQGRYEEENIQLKETYFNQIRKEINEKAKLYGEQKGLDYLFAATGDGSLMYAGESENVTKDFREFIDK